MCEEEGKFDDGANTALSCLEVRGVLVDTVNLMCDVYLDCCP